MSEDSILQASTRNRVTSISTKARRIVFICLVLLVAICFSAVGSMRIQSTQVDFLVLTIGPAVHTNIEIFRDMTVAKAELLEYQISRDPNLLETY